MPIEFGLWRIDNDEFTRVPSGKLDDESRLEALLTKDPYLLGGNLLDWMQRVDEITMVVADRISDHGDILAVAVAVASDDVR